MFELADIHVERGTAQMTALQRIGESVFVDDLASRDVDEYAALLHRGETIVVEQARGFRCPLTADHDDIAARKEPVEIFGTADLGETGRQHLVRPLMAARADHTHAKRR